MKPKLLGDKPQTNLGYLGPPPLPISEILADYKQSNHPLLDFPPTLPAQEVRLSETEIRESTFSECTV